MFDVTFDFDNNIINYNYNGNIEKEFIIDITDIDNNLRIFNTVRTVSPNCGYWTKPNYSLKDTNGICVSFTDSNKTSSYYKSIKTNLDKNLYIDNKRVKFYNIDNCQYPSYDEVILGDTYKKININENDIVIDIGANIGMFSLLCLSKNVKKIYAVEPVEKTFDIFQKNLDEYKEKIIAFNFGLGDFDGDAEFFSNGWSTVNSLCQDFYSTATFSVPVKMRPFENFMNSILEEKIDIMKIDVEASEYDMFNNISDKNILRVDKFIIEIHPVKSKKIECIHNIINRLIKLGYFYSGDLWTEDTYNLLISNLSNWGPINNAYFIKQK